MKRKADALIAEWKADKLWGSLSLCWLATVFSAFFNSYLFPIPVPGIGTMFLFRFLLPITALLYLFWAVRERENPWKGATAVEKWVYVLMGVLILYGAASLFRALDRAWTFQELFNLCLDLCFFYLMLRLCRNGTLRRRTMALCAVMLALLCVLGLLEVFKVFPHGLVNSGYDTDRLQFFFFDQILHYPIVFSTNLNDYISALIFLFASLLLETCASKAEDRRKYDVWIMLSASAILFMSIGSTSRLCQVALLIILAGIFIRYLLLNRPYGPRNAALLLLCCFCVQFSVQYRFIVPPIQRYVSEMAEYRQQQAAVQPDPGTSDTPAPPTLKIGNPQKETLQEQFFTTNEETGEQELRETGSAGIRTHLLIHAFNCFRESYGLGVGLGNTETLAARRAVVPEWAHMTQNSIHCFAARIAADYGLFVVIPLCAIAFLLLKRVWELFAAAVREKDRSAAGFSILFLFVMLSYPFSSTASSDAVNIISMWIYLASLVLSSERLKTNRKEEMQSA